MPRLLLIMLALVCCITTAFPFAPPSRPQRIGVAYYDLGGLYDTIPSPFYDDDDFTPQGCLHWTASRYRRSVERFASVIDSMALPLVGLGGVENEGVVRDLAGACTLDYSYLHRTLNTLDGLDMALLYYGDRFFPDRTETGSGWLLVEGELDGRAAAILLCGRHARFVAQRIARLREEEPERVLLVAGRTEGIDPRAAGLNDALREMERRGFGNVRRRSGWRMEDRILADTSFHTVGGGVYARRRLLDLETGSPLPLHDRRGYRGGFSDRLPVFTYLFP